MIPGLKSQLIGIKEGEERTLNVKFPDDYHATEMAGKEAIFEVKATEVAEEVLPEVDEELAKSFGVEEGGIEKFREEIRDNLSREAEDRTEITVRDAIFQAVLENNEIDVPKALARAGTENAVETAEKEQPEIRRMKKPWQCMRKLAERRVALGLILAEITES